MGYFDYDDDYGFEEDDLLTNFSGYQLELYQKAIKGFGDETLYISDVAYDNRGRRLSGDYSLRVTKHKDRSEFWKFFNELRNKEIV